MTVYIDADSCPSLVRNHVLKICNAKNISVVFAANRELVPEENQTFEMIVCGSEKDAADNYIFDNSKGAEINAVSCADDKYGYRSSSDFLSAVDAVKQGSDLVITRDLLLAKRLTEKNVACINDRGREFTKKNIDGILKEREEDLMFVSMGLVKHSKGSSYNKKEFAAFANSFDKIISEI
ncbi:MAG: DUF188 domain-containing protein [Treponema sp.]|nr:DUF188 domain-containing protein [Treponema sp.]